MLLLGDPGTTPTKPGPENGTAYPVAYPGARRPWRSDPGRARCDRADACASIPTAQSRTRIPKHTRTRTLARSHAYRYINLQRDREVGSKDSRSVDAMREQSYKVAYTHAHATSMVFRGAGLELTLWCEQVMDAAWQAGIRYFDAARSYGKSEEFLQGWLQSRNIPPDQVAVGSKWGYRYTADWRIDTNGEPHEVKDHSAAHFASQSAETLALLGDYINLYQV